MHSDDEEYSGSDSDPDPEDEFNEDMEALRRACLLTGMDANGLSTTSPRDAAATTASSSDEDDDGEDDIELVRNLQKRFACSEEPLMLKPLFLFHPEDDCEDDFETLRAIQRRFAAYNDGGCKESAENNLDRPEQVGVSNNIASEKEASDNLFVKPNSIVEEGFANCVDTDNGVPQKPGENGDVVTTDLVEWNDSGAENVPLPLKTSSLPKPALAFIDAIKKNRACQKVIRSKLMQIEARMEEVKKLKERVKILKDFQVGCKKRTSQALSQKKDARVQLISAVKQRPIPKLSEKKTHAMCYGPPENPRVAIFREALTRYPISVSREKWSKKESENLAKGLKQQFQEMLLRQSMDLIDHMDELSGDASEFDNIIASIRDREITPQNIRSFLPKINWEQLASMYIPGRSGAECQARWLNCEDPLINRDPWTNLEEKNLLYIIQQKGRSNWIDIAVSLGTNRTPFQCLAHYQRSLNASIIRREWTKEEDDELRAAVEEYGESNWQNVASFIEGRTGTQCSNRWKKTLHPARKRIGRWTPEEDKRLKVAVKLFGAKNWWKIAEFVPGRMQAQCRERWANNLDPSLNLDKWTAEEDLMLEEAIKENGYSWSKVAACVPRRTDNQCRRRWMVLFPDEVPLLRAAKRVQKAAFISNFVDRESQRPALGPDDFLPLPAIDPSSEPENVNPSANKKKKSRQRQKHTEKDASTCSNYSEEDARLTNGTNSEDGQEVGMSGRDIVNGGRKGSRKRKRKSIAGNGTQISVGDRTDGTNGEDGQEVGMSGRDIVNGGRKGSRKWKRKSIAGNGTQISVGDHTNGTNGEDGQEVGMSGRDIVNGGRKGSRKWKRKSIAGNGTQISVGDRTNGTNGEDGQEVGMSGRDIVNGGRKGSRKQKRKSIAGNGTQISVGDRTNGTNGDDGQEVGMSGRDIVNGGRKGSRKRKRKSIAGNGTQISVGDRTNGANGEYGQEVGTCGGDLVNGVGKGSRRRKRKSIAADDTQRSVAVCTNGTNGGDGQEVGMSGRDIVNGGGIGSCRQKRRSSAVADTQISVGDCTNSTNGEYGQEVGTSGRDLVNGGGKGSRKRKRKSIAGDGTQMSVGDHTNGANGEYGQEVGTSGGDLVNGAGRGSQWQKRKSIADDHSQISVGDCANMKHKRRKSKSSRVTNNGAITVQCNLSSLPNSTSEVLCNEEGVHHRKKTKNATRKTKKACSGNEFADPSTLLLPPCLGERDVPEDSRIASETDAELLNVENNNFGPCCVQIGVLESGNPNGIMKKLKSTNGASSPNALVVEVGQDHLTLASSLPQSGEPKNLSSSTELAESGSVDVQCTAREKNCTSATGIGNRRRPKRSRTRDEASSYQMLEAGSADPSCKKSKKTRIQPAEHTCDTAVSIPHKEVENATIGPVGSTDVMVSSTAQHPELYDVANRDNCVETQNQGEASILRRGARNRKLPEKFKDFVMP